MVITSQGVTTMTPTTNNTHWDDERYGALLASLRANGCTIIPQPPRDRLTMAWASPWLDMHEPCPTRALPAGISVFVEVRPMQGRRCYVVWEHNGTGEINERRFRQLQRWHA